MASKLSIGYILQDLEVERDRQSIQLILEKFKDQLEFIEYHDDMHIESNYLILFDDRTLLQLSSHATELPPIFVIELPGSHSFFADFPLHRLESLLNAILDVKHEIEKRYLLRVETDKVTDLALNDVYVVSSIPNTRIRFELFVDGRELFDQPDSSNGFLISTPTGSTAMAMNMGGSLIHSAADVIQFQSIASRNYLLRNIILSSKTNLTIEILDANYPLFLQVDSRRYEVDSTNFKITRSEQSISFVKFNLKEPNRLDTKLTEKLTLEDTADLTSSAKFVLHVLQQQDKGMKINEIMDITHITNQKTMRNSLKLLIEKGIVRKQDNLEDMREHLYFYNDPALSRFYS